MIADIAIGLGLWLGARAGTTRSCGWWCSGLRRDALTDANAVARRRCCSRCSRAPLARTLPGATRRGRASARRLGDSGGPRGRLGVHRPALVEDVADRSDRVADGAVLGVLTLAGAGLVAALVAVGSRGSLGEVRRRRIGRALLVVAALGVFAVLAGGAVAVGNAVSSDTSCAEVVNDPSRLGSLDVSNRWCWWNEAVDVRGKRAGGRGRRHVRDRAEALPLRCAERHAAAQRAPAAACRGGASRTRVVRRVRDRRGCRLRGLRRLDGGERAAAAALVAAPRASPARARRLQLGLPLAVTAPTMVALGVLVAAGHAPGARRVRPVLGVGAVLLAVALLRFVRLATARRHACGSQPAP